MSETVIDIWEAIESLVDTDVDAIYTKTVGVILILLCSCGGVTLNLFAFSYFRKKYNIFNTIFRLVTALDVLICCLAFLPGVSYLANRHPMAFSFQPLCEVWGLLWRFVTAFSAHLVGVMSVVRTYKLYCPCRIVSYRAVYCIVAADFTFLVMLGLTVPVLGVHQAFVGAWACCSPNFPTSIITSMDAKSFFMAKLPVLCILVPVAIITVSYVACLLKIWKQKRKMHKVQRRDTLLFKSAGTIIAYTSAYLVCHLPWVGFLSHLIYSGYSGKTLQEASTQPWWVLPYLSNLAYILSIPLNSCTNPLLYMWRIMAFRRYLANLFAPLFRGIIIRRRSGRRRDVDIELAVISNNGVPITSDAVPGPAVPTIALQAPSLTETSLEVPPIMRNLQSRPRFIITLD